MPADLIVYGLIAAGLVFWLRSVLGTRHGDERQRPSHFSGESEQSTETSSLSPEQTFMPRDVPPSQEEQIAELLDNEDGILSIAGKSAEDGLLEIARSDRNFDIHRFLEGAQEAFVMVVEAFAEGDREALQDLLTDTVYSAFEAAIVAREANDERQETEIHAIRKAEVIEAKVENKIALVTMRFQAEETSVTYDRDGEISSGHPDKVTDMRDVWVFGREIRSRDPRWFLFETRSDFEGDNEILPNSHE